MYVTQLITSTISELFVNCKSQSTEKPASYALGETQWKNESNIEKESTTVDGLFTTTATDIRQRRQYKTPTVASFRRRTCGSPCTCGAGVLSDLGQRLLMQMTPPPWVWV